MSATRAPALLLVTSAMLGAAAAAWAQTPAVSASASSSVSSSAVASVAPSVGASASAIVHGLSPMPDGSAIPKALLPPGAPWPDVGPSRAVYPAQSIPLRFDHGQHVRGQKLACVRCHAMAEKSRVASDRLVPSKHESCDSCHAIDEGKPDKVASPAARCDACHLGVQRTALGVTVPKLVLPNPNLKFDHAAHAQKGIGCEKCHGDVGGLELATRDQLPRMRGCIDCHAAGDAGGIGKMKGAKGACTTCHLQEKDGTIRTMFSSGVLSPPRWMNNAQHGSDWLERHKRVAGASSSFCGNCHTESQCNTCHADTSKPHAFHPNDWMNLHAVSARFDSPKCSSCHSTSNFCTPCHTRAGLSPGLSAASVATAARFHPPAAIWSATKRAPGHHAFEAQKNINACVSCHVERDCVSCHGGRSVGGAGFDPHGPGFRCASAFARNPRPCYVCHLPGDRELESCR
jgi:hypothetical protein